MVLNNKIYVIISKWAYPFGGGEEFLFQTMKYAHLNNMKSYWLSFCDAKNKPFEKLTIDEHDFGICIKVPNCKDEGDIINNSYYWLKLLKPDIIHHQGYLRELFYNVSEQLRIEFLTGFHFWSGAIILDPERKNIDILQNAKYHETDPEIIKLWPKKYMNYYTVTPFVSECIETVTGKKINKHIYASSCSDKCLVTDMNILSNKYVSIINYHKLKGGDMFLYLIKKHKNIPFLGVRTEYMSDSLDAEIELAAKEHGNCVLLDRQSDPKNIYCQTRILLAPSLCDETFCRVVNEGMMNGIPIITTGQGNIKYLTGTNCIIEPYDSFENWSNHIVSLYNNEQKLLEYSSKSKKGYSLYSDSIAFRQFTDLTSSVLLKSKEHNVMIFAPWCDQGLGIQARNYAKILSESHFKCFIFALKPYNADSCIALQKNPEEWIFDNIDQRIYYSPNIREKVKNEEILTFINKYNIGKCLLPETCWNRVFEIAQLLRSNSIKCYAIPNVEIVRKDEIFKHKWFHKILCNNNQCKDIFNKFGVTNTEYISYSIKSDNIAIKPTPISDTIKFLFIGGMNAFSRKHILEVCEAFVIATKKYNNIKLTCTVQMTNELEIDSKFKIEEYKKNKQIEIIESHMTYSKIIDLYYNSHICLQVSKHEGLGLGFHESISTGTPIITLDAAPHNEIVLNGINGWIIPCYFKPMTDNKDALFGSAYFDPVNLYKCIANIVNNFTSEYPKITKNLITDYYERLHINHFKETFLTAINS